jgi:BirA family biotin operon repressor/biotin-[acetyl-CoA-carboxylase] ligase
VFGQPLHRHLRVDSTQALARELAEAGTPEGTTVIATEQMAGRGRLGNTFHSPPGGLYLSVVLRPRLGPASAPLIGLAASLGIAEAIRQVTGLVPSLKWPNDVLIGRRKVAGVLVDMAADSGAIHWALLGVGVNVNTSQFPLDLRATATSIDIELGHAADLHALLAALLGSLNSRYHALQDEGPEQLLTDWHASSTMWGQTVRTSDGTEGIAEALDADGALLLRQAGGGRKRVVAGEVHLLATG